MDSPLKEEEKELERNPIAQEHYDREHEGPADNVGDMAAGSEGTTHAIEQTDPCNTKNQNEIPISQNIQHENQEDLNGEINQSIEHAPLSEQSEKQEDDDDPDPDQREHEELISGKSNEGNLHSDDEKKDKSEMIVPSEIIDDQSLQQLNTIEISCSNLQSLRQMFLKVFGITCNGDFDHEIDDIRLKAKLTIPQHAKLSEFCEGYMSDYVTYKVMPVDNEVSIPLKNLKIYFLPYLKKTFLSSHQGSISHEEKDNILTIKNLDLDPSEFEELYKKIDNEQRDIVCLQFFLKDIKKDALDYIIEDKSFFYSPFFAYLQKTFQIKTWSIFQDTKNLNSDDQKNNNVNKNQSYCSSAESDIEGFNSGIDSLTKNSEIILFGYDKTQLEKAKNFLSEFEISSKEFIFPDLAEKQMITSNQLKQSVNNQLKKEITSTLPSMFKELFNATMLKRFLADAKEKHLNCKENNRTSSQVRFSVSGAHHNIAIFFKEWDEIITTRFKSTIFFLQSFKDQFIEKIIISKINLYIASLPKQQQEQLYCIKDLSQEKSFIGFVYLKDKSSNAGAAEQSKSSKEIKTIKKDLKRLISLKVFKIQNLYFKQQDQLGKSFMQKKTKCQLEQKQGTLFLIGTDEEIEEGKAIVQEHFSKNVLVDREFTFSEKIECRMFVQHYLSEIQVAYPEFAIIPNMQAAYPTLKYQISKFNEEQAATRLHEMQEKITAEIYKSVECCTVEQFGLLEDDRIGKIEEQLGVEVLSDPKQLSNIGHQVRALMVDPSDYSKFKVLESRDLQVTLIAGKPESIAMEELLLSIMVNGNYLDSQAQLVVRTANVGQFVFKDINKYNSKFGRNSQGGEFQSSMVDSSYGNSRNNNAVQNRDNRGENNNIASSSRGARSYYESSSSGIRNSNYTNQDLASSAQVYYANGERDTCYENSGGQFSNPPHQQRNYRVKPNPMVMYQSTSMQNFPQEKITFSILHLDFSNLDENIKRFLTENIISSNFGLILPSEMSTCRIFLESIRRIARGMESNGDYAELKHRPNLLLFCTEEKFKEIYSYLITDMPNELLLHQNYAKKHSPIVHVQNQYAYEDDQDGREFPGELSRLLNHLVSVPKLDCEFFYAMLPSDGRKKKNLDEQYDDDEDNVVEQKAYQQVGESKPVRIIIPPNGSDQKPTLIKDNKEYKLDIDSLLRNKNYGAPDVIRNLKKAVKQAQNMKIDFLTSYMNQNVFCFDLVKVLMKKNKIKYYLDRPSDRFKIIQSTSDSNRGLQYVIRGRKQDVEEADRLIKTTLLNPFQCKLWDHKYVNDLQPNTVVISKDTADKLEQSEFQKYLAIFKKEKLQLLSLTFLQNMRLFQNFQRSLREIHSKWEEKPAEKEDMCFTAPRDVLVEIYSCTEIGFDVRVHAGMNIGIDADRFNSHCIALTSKPQAAMRQNQVKENSEEEQKQYCLICKVITGHSLMFKEDMKDMKRLPKIQQQDKGFSQFYDSLAKEDEDNNMAAISNDGIKGNNNPNDEDDAEEIDVVGIFDNNRIYPMYLAEYLVSENEGYIASGSRNNTDTQSN